MGTINVPNDASFGLRSEVTADQLARGAREHLERIERSRQITGLTACAALPIVCVGLFWPYRRRSEVLSAADDFAVSAGASGLKAKRRVQTAISLC